MNLIQHPNPQNEMESAYNKAVASQSWRKGFFGVAFDIYDFTLQRHLFRSYSLDDAETLGEWEGRNGVTDWRWMKPAWKPCEFVPYIPTARAISRTPTSLQNIADILAVNYSIALQGADPVLNSISGNNLRQMLHHSKVSFGRPFIVRDWLDDRNGYIIRAAIGHADCVSFDITPCPVQDAG